MMVYYPLIGEKVSGKIALSGFGSDEAKISAHMTQLSMRKSVSKSQDVTIKADQSQSLIAIDAVIEEFELDDVELGAVTFRATPNDGLLGYQGALYHYRRGNIDHARAMATRLGAKS
jgi:hypothetical protein